MFDELGKQKIKNNTIKKSIYKNDTMILNNKASANETVTSLPTSMKSECENLTNISLDGVTVHHNSEKPYAINALAYAQGNDIYLARNQEKYLKHELWHVIQQKQGRVKPKNYDYSVPINDDNALEKEAQEFLFRRKNNINQNIKAQDTEELDVNTINDNVIQRMLPSRVYLSFANGYRSQAGVVAPHQQLINIGQDLNAQGEIDIYHSPNYDEFLDALRQCLLTTFDILEQNPVPANPTVSHLPGDFSQFIEDGFDAFNRFSNFRFPNGVHLPDVQIDRNHTSIGAFMQENGRVDMGGYQAINGLMNVGIGSGMTQVSHELGHHLENNLSLVDFLTIHNFLRARTRNVNGGDRRTGQAISENRRLTGYNAVFPEMNFMNPLSRFLFDRGSIISLMLYNGLNILSQNNIRDYFYQVQGSQNVSYASSMYDDYGTEFISTTIELLVDRTGRERLIETDPLRAVLFLYVANRPEYNHIRQLMLQIDVLGGTNDLDQLIHIVNH